MSMIAQPRLLTAEEFLLLARPQDGSEQELVRGEIITLPPPGTLHGVTCSRVNRRLGNFVDQYGLGIVTCNDAGFVTERGPDSVRARRRLLVQGAFAGDPDRIR